MIYTVVSEDSSASLIDTVRELIGCGWRPMGGVSHTVYTWEVEGKGYTEIEHTWAQAMVKGGDA